MKKRLFLMPIFLSAVALSACAPTLTTDTDSSTRSELVQTCNVVFKALNRITDVNNDLILYNNAVNHYAETGRYDEFIDFNPSAPKNYFDAYEKSSEELGDLRVNLFPSTAYFKTQIDAAIFLLMNHDLYITFYNNNTTLITKDLWEARRLGLNAVGDEINEICSVD